jgi:TolB-like protein/Flp pilus assembly protein TadD
LSLFNELKRRNVLRAGIAYLAGAWLLIQIAETIFPLFGFGDTPARIVVILLSIAFVPVLIFAWAFELTSEGIKKESEVDRTQSFTPNSVRKFDRAIMIVLALALGYFAVDKFVLSESREAIIAETARQEGRSETLMGFYGEKSIVVLPFVNMSSDVEQEYFSDGISEELLNLLAKIPELRVISRTSAFSFKGQNLEIPEIAKKLNVSHVLEGSVRKAGNTIRITAQLIDARSDMHLWSRTYDRDLKDIFAIQDEVAASVVDELEISLLSDLPKVRETDPEAYALFLQARFFIGQVATEESTLTAIELLKQALEIDDTYVPAWVLLANANGNMMNWDALPLEEAEVRARAAIQSGFEVDPNDPAVLGLLGLHKITLDNDIPGSVPYLRRALELDPLNYLALENTEVLFFYLGRYDESVSILEYLLNLEPLNIIFRANLIAPYCAAGRFQDALELAEAIHEAQPDKSAFAFWEPYLKLRLGDAQGALEAATHMQPPESRLVITAQAYHELGNKQEFESAFTELLSLVESNPESAFFMALLYAYLGDTDAAFNWLDRADAIGSLSVMPYDMYYSNLHDDPRWSALQARRGISLEQLDAIEFEVNLPVKE